jgi:hypothetical protein
MVSSFTGDIDVEKGVWKDFFDLKKSFWRIGKMDYLCRTFA